MSSGQQSPINIKETIQATYDNPLKIRWSRSLNGELTQHDGKISVVFNGDSKDWISFDGKQFQIAQFHFHHKSEHWINGKQFPMELHIVHRNCDPDDGSLGVLGILIEAGESDLEPQLIREISMMQNDDSYNRRSFKTNPREWLPADIEHYYRYEGSLTTPSYDEIVSWIVFKDSLKIPRKLINSLVRCAAEPSRLPQPLNRRFVLSNFA